MRARFRCLPVPRSHGDDTVPSEPARRVEIMVQVSYPGVYVVEVPSGVHTITGVGTSTAAFFGRASRGPMNRAVRITSFPDYTRTFGDPHPASDLATSVRQFFENGGTDCYVVRLAAGA